MTNSGLAKATLPSETELLITRTFDAPRHLVYRAWTEPELIKGWWGGDRGVVTVAEVDLRVGGQWRYVTLAHGEFEVAFHGEFREIRENEFLAASQIYESFPDVVAEATTTFTEVAGHTTLTILVRHPSQATRDMHLASGMQEGMNESMDHLQEVVASLR